MLFRGSQKKETEKNSKFSLPGSFFIGGGMSPKRRRLDFPGRAGFCISGIWKKGSFTVEAAFALPLFFLTVLSLIGLMGIYGSYAHTMVSLQQQAESQALLQIYRQEESTVPVRLRETVKADLSLLPFQAGTAQAVVMAQVLPWTGRADYSSLAAADSDSGKLYYLSDHQSVYHTSSSCTYLSLQISAMEAGRLSRAKNGHGERYHACEKCVGAGGTAAVVYVTPNGEHFHNSADCSGLKRSVHLVEESDIAGLHLCSRCSRREAAQ